MQEVGYALHNAEQGAARSGDNAMKQREVLVAVKNAAANLFRGASVAILTLVLPPFLTRMLPVEVYGAWSLVLQLSAYVSYLDLGLQTAVGRFVAHSTETGDRPRRDAIVSTALVMLATAALLAFAGLLILVGILPMLFRQMPSSLVSGTRLAVLLVGASLALGLPASVLSAVFIGLQRNEVPAIIVAASKFLGATALLLAAEYSRSLVVMAAIVACTNVVTYAIQYVVYMREASQIRVNPKLASWSAARELSSYCLSLAVWTFGMLLVTGLDLTIVAWYDFRSVAYYSVAASVVTFMNGTQNALFGALVSPVAVHHARQNERELGLALLHSTRYGMILLLVAAVPLCFAAKPLLTLWVGASYAQPATPLLVVLVVATVVRLSTTPFSAILIGTGQQKLVILTPLAEGIVNLVASLVAGRYFGALGVAFGTLVGSLVCLLGHLFYNMPRTAGIRFTRAAYVRDGLLRPLLTSLPAILTCAMAPLVSRPAQIAVWVLAMTELVGFNWAYGLTEGDRSFIGHTVRRTLQIRFQA
ncbi:MAG: polysaccharide biosynthesis C-terminal domain-containing protein [Candidatus Korobacteraceae bacterium]